MKTRTGRRDAWGELSSAGICLSKAVDRYVKAAKACEEENRRRTQAIVRRDMADIGGTIKRDIGHLVTATGRTWHDVWVEAYRRLARLTGFDAAVVSSREHMSSRLDAVRKYGYGKWLQWVVHRMLEESTREDLRLR